MFPSPLRAHLVLLIAYVATVSAAPPVNAPPESSFAITSPTGSRQILSGSVNYDPTHVANMDETGALAALAPGEPISVTHDLPVTYSFAQSEAGDDSIETSNPFIYVGADDTHKDLHATVEGIAKLKLSRNRHVHGKRINWRRGRSRPKQAGPQGVSSGSSLDPKFSGCPGPHVKTIRRSAEVARTILTRAITAIQRSMSNRWNRETYEMWFGRYSESRRTTVLRNFERMMDKLSFPGFTFDCNCGGPDPSDLIAERRLVMICYPFWGLELLEGQAVELLRIAGRLIRTLGAHTTSGLWEAHAQAMSDPLLGSTNLDSYIAYILDEDYPTPPHGPPSSFRSSLPGSPSPPFSQSSSDTTPPNDPHTP